MLEYKNIDQVNTIDHVEREEKRIIEILEEPIICENCGHINIVHNKIFVRREKKPRHIPLSDVVYSRLGQLTKGGYGNVEVALQYLFHIHDKYERMVKEKHEGITTEVEPINSTIDEL